MKIFLFYKRMKGKFLTPFISALLLSFSSMLAQPCINPAAPTSVTANPTMVCPGQTSNLSAISVGNGIDWYSTPSGGVLLGSSASGANFPVTLAVNTTYYAEAVVPTLGFQTFASSGTFTVPSGVTSVKALVVGGGGGGANGHQGGGGSGYVQTGTYPVTPGQSIAITVGTGGTGAITQNANNNIVGLTPGTASSFGSFLTANGGLVVSGVNQTGNDGGSGGGGACNSGPIGGDGGTGGASGTGCTYSGGNGQGSYAAAIAVFTTNPITAGAGGVGGQSTHAGGGGGGGILINGAGPSGANGVQSWSGMGGQGYGAGGGAGGYDAIGPIREEGGNGADGVVYLEWGSGSGPCVSLTRTPVTVTIGTTAPTSVMASPDTICAGTTANLSAVSAGNSIRWYTTPTGGVALGSSASGANFPVTPSGSTIYYAEAFGGGNCISTTRSQVSVTVIQTPSTPVISPGGSPVVCSGSSLVLTSSNPSGNIWNTNATTPSITVSIADTFTVITVIAGCSSAVSAPVITIVNPSPPAPTITPAGSISFCAGDSAILVSSDSVGIAWSPGGASTRSIVVTSSGSYTVTVTAAGCSTASAPVMVIVNPVPSPPTISQNGNILTANPPGASYQWYMGGNFLSGANSQTYTASSPGNYTVTVTDSNGCTSAQSAVFILTGIENGLNGNDFISVFPNPNTGIFNLKISGIQLQEAKINSISLDGSSVFQDQLGNLKGGFEKQIDLSNLADGIYFLQVNTGTETVIRKLIKQGN